MVDWVVMVNGPKQVDQVDNEVSRPKQINKIDMVDRPKQTDIVNRPKQV